MTFIATSINLISRSTLFDAGTPLLFYGPVKTSEPRAQFQAQVN